jgi:creatinine amidohydrolase/Fe(II)-dependent formamide hydrolase-like protein
MVLHQVLDQAAQNDGHTLVAPLLRFAPQMTDDAVGALRWPGTLHASPSTLASVIGDILTSVKVHGAHKMVLVSEDPQTLPALRDTANALNSLWQADGVTVMVTENLIEPSRDARLIEAAHLPAEPAQARGGLLETSEMLACCAEQVRMARLPRTPSAVDASGAQGHPHLAQAALGVQSVTLKAAAVEQALEQIRATPKP